MFFISIKKSYDIEFLEEKDVKDDTLAWNCLNANKYSKT